MRGQWPGSVLDRFSGFRINMAGRQSEGNNEIIEDRIQHRLHNQVERMYIYSSLLGIMVQFSVNI